MTRPRPSAPPGRALALAGLVALQSMCAAFFLADVLGDLGRGSGAGEGSVHLALEFAVAAALVLGVVFGAREVRRLLARQARMEDSLRAAGGAFAELLAERFDLWGLTPAERDVALMAVKGLSLAEIAAARGTAEGTAKAQAAAVYAKAGVSNRAQLLSLFIEDLLAEPLRPPASD